MVKSEIEDLGATEAIKKELETVEMANHPQIVRVFQLLESDDNLYILMEYFKLGSLERVIIAEDGFQEDACIRIMTQVFKAL